MLEFTLYLIFKYTITLMTYTKVCFAISLLMGLKLTYQVSVCLSIPLSLGTWPQLLIHRNTRSECQNSKVYSEKARKKESSKKGTSHLLLTANEEIHCAFTKGDGKKKIFKGKVNC